jgi:hypothetical protein
MFENFCDVEEKNAIVELQNRFELLKLQNRIFFRNAENCPDNTFYGNRNRGNLNMGESTSKDPAIHLMATSGIFRNQ